MVLEMILGCCVINLSLLFSLLIVILVLLSEFWAANSIWANVILIAITVSLYVIVLGLGISIGLVDLIRLLNLKSWVLALYTISLF